MNKESKIRGGLHPTMDGNRDGDPHWSTGSQDREECVHPLIQGDCSNESSPSVNILLNVILITFLIQNLSRCNLKEEKFTLAHAQGLLSIITGNARQ